MTEQVSYPALYELVLEYFGAKLDLPTSNDADKVMTCVLYDAFPFSCGLGEHGEFGAGITVGPDDVVDTLLGRDISMNSDRKSILRSLALVDEYCRLRLPGKYLRAFERTHSIE